jgi:hypothetical protein
MGLMPRRKKGFLKRLDSKAIRKGLNPLVGHAHNNRASKASKVLYQRMGSYGMPDCICT